jgi:hypothetical protein
VQLHNSRVVGHIFHAVSSNVAELSAILKWGPRIVHVKADVVYSISSLSSRSEFMHRPTHV